MVYTFEPIGFIRSPYKEKFGIPRQPGLIAEARGELVFAAPYNRPEAVIGLEGYSHVWLQFVFHQALRDEWQPMVRPPRLGGNKRVGVFASRSPFRPNPIGLSVVKLEQVRAVDGEVVLELSGIDLLDGTPVLDVKPYVGYVDSIPEARSGFAPEAPAVRFQVLFSALAKAQLLSRCEPDQLRRFITRLLEVDPRPAYSGDSQPGRIYGIRLYDFDLRWRINGDRIEVLELASPGVD
ncbi:tRNA (N6-threonylcarbamoyladenosine(37)-N6)-methyltransferase TrmO [Sedimenticola selenatireducens]|uniref:tRNA (N6-threonylcarbamoyladenosine(37)-N6)-methyltransferase TrmO n=1 Tax=Sedimenticola selenatireducens TaxID=191960 RepID=A0A2N6CRI1_9GAMM|nr:tRNA (N6-threonylcarbamoyladenosine(37)-N6)-methyltransferase TrmO [Sedimenticola selenatireducens]PLX59669.1 MAG: tRNA (N6-threonylcarbamoyladenosine(37)-N6)-methyltransferase TrmO [Sedimenticola selenatireducens]